MVKRLIAVVTCTFVRIRAVMATRVENCFTNGRRWWVCLNDYIKASSLTDEGKIPFSRSAVGRIGCHTFCATGITAYLESGGTLQNGQATAAHEGSRTTRPYDRTGDVITLDEVERIGICRTGGYGR